MESVGGGGCGVGGSGSSEGAWWGDDEDGGTDADASVREVLDDLSLEMSKEMGTDGWWCLGGLPREGRVVCDCRIAGATEVDGQGWVRWDHFLRGNKGFFLFIFKSSLVNGIFLLCHKYLHVASHTHQKKGGKY